MLGPLQDIINADVEFRVKIAYVKQLKKKIAGLSNAKPDQFHLYGLCAQHAPVLYMLGTFKGKDYTLRILSKKQVDLAPCYDRLTPALAVTFSPLLRTLTLLLTHFTLFSLAAGRCDGNEEPPEERDAAAHLHWWPQAVRVPPGRVPPERTPHAVSISRAALHRCALFSL